MKFGFFTDSHFRDDTPKSRIDDIWQAQMNKLDEINEIAKDNELDFMIEGGDFFNTKKPSHKLVRAIIRWANQLPCPLLGIIGNHDVTGYNLDSSAQSGIGVLFESGVMKRLDLIEDVNEKVVIKAVHVNAHAEQNYGDDYMFDEKYKDWKRIIISHNYIIPEDSMPFGFVHPKDIKTNAHLVLCGHYHTPFNYTTKTTAWINSGPICRWAINEAGHKPNVVIVSIEDGFIGTKSILLESAKRDVFDLESVEDEKKHKLNLDAFANSLEQTSFSNVNIESLVKETGDQQRLPMESIELILEKIKEAREVLN
ncbi:MAG: metallophosphoesterase [Thermodesulfobacteriota bacterium]